jgi:hypothetical protein
MQRTTIKRAESSGLYLVNLLTAPALDPALGQAVCAYHHAAREKYCLSLY